MGEQSLRNYRLIGPEGERARQKGLVEANWYTTELPRKQLKQLMVRRDWPAWRDTLIWLSLLVACGYVAYLSWGTWWAIPMFFIYGTIYRVSSYGRWHEYSHGTPFRTSWLNEAMYQLTSFMNLYQATLFRWSHARHHTDTVIVGRDREFITIRPPNRLDLLLNIFRFVGLKIVITDLFRRCLGRITEEEKTFIPPIARQKLFWEARVWVLILLSVIGLSIYTHSILPFLFVVLPSFYGNPLNLMLVMTQHAGLVEDVVDYRLNTRTFHTNRVLQFLYCNMNYHLEHHMYPMVPYYNLPALHQAIQHDCPPAYSSFWAAFQEAVIAIWRQRGDPAFSVERRLPHTARPFRYHPIVN